MQRRLFYLLLWYLQVVLGQVNILYDNSSINFGETASKVLNTNGGYVGERCRKLVVLSSGIYHMGHDSSIQNWVLSNWSSNGLGLTVSPYTYVDFVVQTTEVTMRVLVNNGTSSFLFLTNPAKAMSFLSSIDVAPTPTQIFLVGSSYYYFYQNYNGTDAVYDGSTYKSVATVNGKLYASRTNNLFAIADPTGVVYLYSSTFVLQHTFIPTNPTFGTISTIIFDSTSSLMIIQTDADNPLLIVNVQNYNVIHSVDYTGQTGATTIKMVAFIDSVTTYIIIWGNNGRYIYDTRSGLLHQVSNYVPDTDVIVSGYNKKIYTCSGSTLKQYEITYGPYIEPPSIPSSEEDTEDEEEKYYTSVEDSETYLQISQGVHITIQILNYIALILSSSPFVIYFLGFLNYISLSSLYVLLEISIPEHLYFYLKLLFANFNDDLFQQFGLHEGIQPISPELINRQRPLFFGLSSDMVSSCWPDTSIAFINMAMLLLINGFLSKLFSSRSVIRTYFDISKWQMAMGQIINLLAPYILPWSFLIMQSYAIQLNTKINSLLIWLALFIGLAFPVYYLVFLLQQQKVKVKNKDKDRFKKTFLSELLTVPLLAQWFTCLANSLYPLLVLLESPIYFLLVITIFTLLNVLIFFGDICKNKNSFILSLYPLIFHLCFFVFYFSSSPSILLYTQLVAIFSLLIGLIHNSLTALIKVAHVILKIAKYFLSPYRIDPQPHKNAARGKNKEQKPVVLSFREQKKLPSAKDKDKCKSERKPRIKDSQVSTTAGSKTPRHSPSPQAPGLVQKVSNESKCSKSSRFKVKQQHKEPDFKMKIVFLQRRRRTSVLQ